MNTQQINEQRLRHYLLGTLPAAEIEELDELSFLDDTFAAQLQSVEDNLSDDYVHGELAADEVAPFYTNFLATPRRRDKVKFAQSLQVFTQRTYPPLTAATVSTLSSSPEQVTDSPAAPLPWWRALLNLVAVPSFGLQAGLAAATVLLFAGGSWLAWEAWRMRGQLNQAQAERAALIREAQALKVQLAQQGADRQQLEQQYQQVSERLTQLEQAQQQLPQAAPKFAFFVLTSGMRGAGNVKELVIPPATETVRVRLEFESEDYPNYRAELRTQIGEQLLWSSSKLKARNIDGEIGIELRLNASLFKSQGYRFDLKGIAASGETEGVRSYSFKVVRQ